MVENRTMITRFNIALQLVLAAILFMGINFLGNEKLGPYRLDFTENQLFTLSSGTEDILDNLERPLTLKFYFSENAAAEFPDLYRYGQRVEDFLSEIEVMASGRLVLEKIDPEAFSLEKTEAETYGLLNLGDGDENPFYLGLAGFDDTNRLEVIPRFSEERERFLEFDLAKIIYLLEQAEKPTLGIISGLPLQFGLGGAMAFLQGQSQSYILYNQLGQYFNLEHLEGDYSSIPSDVDVLLIVHPPELTDRQMFAIDQYALGGNPVLVFVDPFAETSPATAQNVNTGLGAVIEESSDLKPLLKVWGIGFARDTAVIDPPLGQRVNVALESGAQTQLFPHWLGVRGDNLNKDDPITAFLSVLNFASSGSLTFTGSSDLAFTPMVWTTEASGLVGAEMVRQNYPPAAIEGASNSAGRQVLSARVTGQGVSAFPNGVDNLRGLASGTINVLVTADADLFEDRFWAALRQEATGQTVLVPIADNAAFVVNAIDYFSGSEALISLRARGVSTKPLEKFQQLRREATEALSRKQEELTDRLMEAQIRLSEIERGGGQANGQDQAEILAQYQNDVRAIEQQLNETKGTLRQNIRGLENQVIFLNLLLVPLFIILLTLLKIFVVDRGRKKP